MNDKQSNELKKKNILVHYLSIGLKPGRIPELDGLRAWAILLVLLYHFSTSYQEIYGSYYRKVISEFFHRFMHNGWLGVDLFFVLSGYLIFNHLLKVQQQPDKVHTYGQYALKRILRTFPLYFAIIGLFVLVIAPSNTGHLSKSDYLIHLFFLQDYFGANILSPLWSLATEEKFYLLAPFVLLFLKRFSPIKSAAILLTVIIGVTVIKFFLINNNDATFKHEVFFLNYRAPFHFAVASIGVGVIVAYLAQVKHTLNYFKMGVIFGVLVIMILCFAELYYPASWGWASILHFFAVILFGCLVLTAVSHSGQRWMRFLCGRTLRVISVLSYALYLSHLAVLPWLHKLHRYWVYSEEAWVHALTFFIMYIGFALLLSLILHYVVEKPFLIIKDKL